MSYDDKEIAMIQELEHDIKSKTGELKDINAMIKQLTEPEPKPEENPDEKCYVCGNEVIYKYDGTGPICQDCAESSRRERLPFTTDEKGRRIFDISNVRGTLRCSSDARPGDLVKENKKLYEFQKDFSLKRIDKK